VLILEVRKIMGEVMKKIRPARQPFSGKKIIKYLIHPKLKLKRYKNVNQFQS